MNNAGASTTSRYTRNGAPTGAVLQPPHVPERFGARSGAVRGADQLLAQAHAAQVRRCTVADYLRFVAIAVYLTGVMAWLVLSRQIRPNFSVRRTIRAFLFRRRTPTAIAQIAHDGGHCYRTAIDPKLLSDAESVSRVQVCENGRPLPHGHCDHAEIREVGRGRFSHWNGTIYFSTNDNTDPRTNGRRYIYKEV